MNQKKLDKQLKDILHDLQARHLAIPAGALLFLIIAVAFALPKSPAPPPPETSPVAQTKPVEADRAAQITLVDTDVSLAQRVYGFKKANPFGLTGGVVSESGAAGGASGSTGAAGGDTGGGTGTGGGGTTDSTGDTTTGTIYLATVTLDDKTYKKRESGEGVPSDDAALVVYVGPNSSNKKGKFLVANGLTVQGAEVDTELGLITLAEGDEVILTEGDGTIHRFSLDNLTKSSG